MSTDGEGLLAYCESHRDGFWRSEAEADLGWNSGRFWAALRELRLNLRGSGQNVYCYRQGPFLGMYMLTSDANAALSWLRGFVRQYTKHGILGEAMTHSFVQGSTAGTIPGEQARMAHSQFASIGQMVESLWSMLERMQAAG